MRRAVYSIKPMTRPPSATRLEALPLSRSALLLGAVESAALAALVTVPVLAAADNPLGDALEATAVEEPDEALPGVLALALAW